MTKKRFELTKSDIKDFRIYDHEKEDAYFIDCDKHTGECLVYLLNDLHKRNEQLEEKLDYLQSSIKEINQECKDVFKS